jgi:dTDP-4-dehydrorhamnose 3,5-epimerase
MYIKGDLDGLWIFEPKILEDHRGHFFESFNQKKFEEATGLNLNFVQDNQSLSHFGVMRGLHFQKASEGQAKLVRVISGTVQDVVVDMRKDSPTYGKNYSIVISAQNKKQMFIPRGFAHGFLVLSDSAEFFYKCDNFYSPKHESGIFFDDPSLGIEWLLPKSLIKISDRDRDLKYLADNSYLD